MKKGKNAIIKKRSLKTDNAESQSNKIHDMIGP